MQHIRSKDTSVELSLRKTLWHKGYRYRKNYKKLKGTPDIVLTKYKIAIFCDSDYFHGKDWTELEKRVLKGSNGEYWHNKIEHNILHDEEVNKILKSEGWVVLRFWSSDIKKHLDDCVQTIEEAVLDQKINS